MSEVLDEEIEWIRHSTIRGMSIESAVPAGFEVYGLLDVDEEQRRTEDILLTALDHTADEAIVAGWIVRNTSETESGDEHLLYSGWRFRCRHVTAAELYGRPVEGGGRFPDLLFPADHRWLIATLRDDSWRSIGSTTSQARLIAALLPRFEQVAHNTAISTTGRRAH